MANIVKIPGKKVNTFFQGTLAYFQTNNALFKCTVLSVSDKGMCRIRLGESTPGYCKGEMLSAPFSLVIPRVSVSVADGITIVNSSYIWSEDLG